jgi:hypothetical protein
MFIELAARKGYSATEALPQGAMIVCLDAPATGNGRLMRGEQGILCELDVSGRTPADIDAQSARDKWYNYGNSYGGGEWMLCVRSVLGPAGIAQSAACRQQYAAHVR